MVLHCKICKLSGQKGFYKIKVDWLDVLKIPPDFELKKHHVVCYRHFKPEDFYFIGDQLRLKRGMNKFRRRSFYSLKPIIRDELLIDRVPKISQES